MTTRSDPGTGRPRRRPLRRTTRNLDPVSIDFEAERDSQRAAAQPTLVGHDYSLQGFITYFDPYWIKQIHKFDPGFTPIERRLTYQLPDGGIDKRYNWGIARYTTLEPAPEWQLRLLHAAVPPTRGTYLATLPRPNLLDTWWPLQRSSPDGMPPPYEPFDGALVARWCEAICAEYAARGTANALDVYNRLQAAYEAKRDREFESELDTRARAAVELFPKISTTNVRSTPRARHIEPHT